MILRGAIVVVIGLLLLAPAGCAQLQPLVQEQQPSQDRTVPAISIRWADGVFVTEAREVGDRVIRIEDRVASFSLVVRQAEKTRIRIADVDEMRPIASADPVVWSGGPGVLYKVMVVGAVESPAAPATDANASKPLPPVPDASGVAGALTDWALVRVDEDYYLIQLPADDPSEQRSERQADVGGRPASSRQHKTLIGTKFTASAFDGGPWGWGVVALGLLLVVGVPVLVPLFSRFSKSDVLNQDRRSRLYDTIAANPGITFTRLQASTGFHNGPVQHHLRQLQQHGLIVRMRDGRTTRFFVRGERIASTDALGETRARIVEHLARDPSLTVPEIAKRLGHRAQSTWRNIRHLERMGAVVAQRDGRIYRWSLAPQRSSV